MTLRNEPVQARSHKRLQEIHDAGWEVLNEVGRDRLTTAMVADRAQMSIGTFYRYYPDRVALLDIIQPLHQVPELGVWVVEDHNGTHYGIFATTALAEDHVDYLSRAYPNIEHSALFRIEFEPIRSTPMYEIRDTTEGTTTS